MIEGLPATWPKTAEEIFIDFRGRRAGLIKALTTDVRQLYQLCDPGKDLLCLYGHPNETWKVGPPAEEVPANIPEPRLGINKARDGAPAKDWLTVIALHCDSWLISVAFYFGSFSEIKKIDRDKLFQMINDLPTVLEVVLGNSKRPNDYFGTHNISSKIKSSRKSRQPKNHTSKSMKMTMAPKEHETGVELYEGLTLCGACGKKDGPGEFWICCDTCDKWFHALCVGITLAEAEHILHYECPRCSRKRTRH
ncbi:PHD finger protein ALFIN-LIKE 7-like isoform X2 [Amaranthus tricolor]|nr:PHD finger protein ALFIN-LIKE 7-like isoform X2 [Amaranthus tricolor]